MSNVLVCQNLTKTFVRETQAVEVLKNISMTVSKGETVSIVGQSGTGKSTLLAILGGLLSPSSGTIHFLGQNLAELKESTTCKLRNKSMGFIFQFHHLLPDFTALENVQMPLMIQGIPKQDQIRMAQAQLQAVDLTPRLDHKPYALSGGEQQRVAIARALVTSPALILADEPTGNLDTVTAKRVAQLMFEAVQKRGAALIVATHSLELAKLASKQYLLKDGELHVA